MIYRLIYIDKYVAYVKANTEADALLASHEFSGYKLPEDKPVKIEIAW